MLSTTPLPVPASNTRNAGGVGLSWSSSAPMRVGDHGLLARRGDEQQVLLAVVEEPERLIRRPRLGGVDDVGLVGVAAVLMGNPLRQRLGWRVLEPYAP